MTTIDGMSGGRFHTLDGMRGLAALAVVLFHMGWLIDLPAMREGYLAVDFFFALSGFVLAGAYERRLRQSLTPLAFVKARILRLYPLYLVGLLIGSIKGLAQIVKHDDLALSPVAYAGSLATGLLMLPSPFSMRFTFPFNPPSWSLFDELFINVIFAVALFRMRNAMLAAVAVVAAIALVIDTHGNAFAGDEWSGFVHGLIRVTYSFTAGLLIWRLPRPGRRATPLSVLPMAAMLILLAPAVPAAVSAVYDPVAIFLIVPALVYLGSFLEIPRYGASLCAFLGDISYPIYAVHLPIVGISWFVLRHSVAPLAFLIAMPISLMAIAWLLARYFDAPVRGRIAAALRIRSSARLQPITID